MADKIRRRVPWFKLFLICLVPVFTFKDAAVNLFSPRLPTPDQRRVLGQQEQVRLQLSNNLQAILCQQLLPRARGRGRVPAVETLVVNTRVAERIRDPQLVAELHV